MKKIKAFGLIGLLVMVLSLMHCSRKKDAQPENTEKVTVAFTVKSVEAQRGSISEYLNFMGIVKSYKTQVILSEVAGKITKLFCQAGDKVKEGDHLFELENTLAQAQSDQAGAALSSARLQRDEAQKNLQRLKNLYEKNGVSQIQYEQAVTAAKLAQGLLEQAEAGKKMTEYQLQGTRVVAPFGGIISGRFKEVGDYVNPAMGGMSPNSGVYTLEEYSTVYVDVDVPYSEVHRIRKGQQVDLLVGNDVLPAKVLSVNEKADSASASVPVRIVAANPGRRLLPATMASVRIHFNQGENRLLAPAAAVIDSTKLFVVEANMARERQVTIGIRNTETVEITSGLSAGERVIVEGNFGLYDKALVKESNQ